MVAVIDKTPATLPCIVVKDSYQKLNLVYWNCSSLGQEWMESFCFSEGHHESDFWWDENEDQLPADSAEALKFVAKVQAHYDSLPEPRVVLELKDCIHDCYGWWS